MRRGVSAALRRSVFARDGFRCKKCRHHAPTGEGLDCHHVIDVMDGGPDTLDNLDTLCTMCHAEWSWLWPAPREVGYAEWRQIAPAVSVIKLLLLGRYGLEIGIPREAIERLLGSR